MALNTHGHHGGTPSIRSKKVTCSDELSGRLSYTGAQWIATIKIFSMIGATPQ
jgi:hypothetical protein